MLVRTPRSATLAEIYRLDELDPATAQGIDVGLTTQPRGYSVAKWQPMVTETLKRSLAQVTVLKASEPGNNTSLYVGEGIYETNHTLAEVPRGDSPASYMRPWENAKQARVYIVMPEDMARMNRQAEQEHVDDFLLAYELTLKTYDRCLAEVKAPTAATRSGAIQELTDALKKLLPMGLKDAAARPAQCEEKYKELAEKSMHRDVSCWHSFSVERCDDPGGLTTHYLTGVQREENGRVFLKIIKGKVEVGVHSSKSLIKF